MAEIAGLALGIGSPLLRKPELTIAPMTALGITSPLPRKPRLAFTSSAGGTYDGGRGWLRDAGAVTEDAVDGVFEQAGDFVDDGADGPGAGRP